MAWGEQQQEDEEPEQDARLLALPSELLCAIVLEQLPRRGDDAWPAHMRFLAFYGKLPLVCKALRALVHETLALSPYELYALIVWARGCAEIGRTWPQLNRLLRASSWRALGGHRGPYGSSCSG